MSDRRVTALLTTKTELSFVCFMQACHLADLAGTPWRASRWVILDDFVCLVGFLLLAWTLWVHNFSAASDEGFLSSFLGLTFKSSADFLLFTDSNIFLRDS